QRAQAEAALLERDVEARAHAFALGALETEREALDARLCQRRSFEIAAGERARPGIERRQLGVARQLDRGVQRVPAVEAQGLGPRQGREPVAEDAGAQPERGA